MTPLAAVGIVAATVVATEALAWAVHRFLMHGPGWGWHRSHHEPGPGRFERNDLYAVVFGAFDLLLFVVSDGPGSLLWWIAAGIAVYGVLYAYLHDGLVHRRWPSGRAPTRGWRARLVAAHRLHHAVRGRDGAVSFGFLWAPSPRALALRLRERRGAGGAHDGSVAAERFEASPGDQASAKSDAPGAGRPRRRNARTDRRARVDTRIGLVLAFALIGAFVGLLAWTLSSWRWDRFGPMTAVAAIPLVALQSWLGAGLFIVAHDAMHGSLAPSRPALGRALGRIALLVYAGFSFDRLLPAHHAHHRHPGTPLDPDFDADHPTRFWPWYARFVRHYFGWRQLAMLAAFSWGAVLLLGVPLSNLLVFWALPAILSSLQLFRWGTYLPHRHDDMPFADVHRARSDSRGRVATLATCFHFGLHHEHHLRPDLPWWRLPALRERARVPDSPSRQRPTVERPTPGG